MSLQAIQQAVNGTAQNQTFQCNNINVFAFIHRWIIANLVQCVLLLINGILTAILIFTPAFLTAPLLAMMGFGATGPIAGE